MLHPARRETWVSPRAGTALLALEAAGKEGIALSQKKKKKNKPSVARGAVLKGSFLKGLLWIER